MLKSHDPIRNLVYMTMCSRLDRHGVGGEPHPMAVERVLASVNASESDATEAIQQAVREAIKPWDIGIRNAAWKAEEKRAKA